MTKFTDMLDGYRRFRENDWKKERERWDELKEGQSPKVMIIACSDSRVDPTQIFDIHPGETFIVRNVAALVPPFEMKHGYKKGIVISARVHPGESNSSHVM